MQVVVWVLLVGTVAAGWVWFCTRGARRRPDPAAAAPLVARLPEGHRPPPGLGPLSPSERFLTQEAARGVHALQQFLAEQPAA